MGRIITFYSYKGGTGRSMALANIGWILASNGFRVLMVDWDVEAPGLHRYFAPFLIDKELSYSKGIMDAVVEFATAALTPWPKGEERSAEWYSQYADMANYVVSIQWSHFGKRNAKPGSLDLVPSGQQGPGYATRVNSFSWDNFYERLGGGKFIDHMKRSMRDAYDYVLIDSRTGVSDTSGICTVQLPDCVVVCFTLNNQSILGASAAAAAIASQHTDPHGKVRVPIYPVPMRVDTFESDRLEIRRKLAKKKFESFLGFIGDTDPNDYWNNVEVPYKPLYAYEELLTAFGDNPGDPKTTLAAFERLSGYLTGNEVQRMPPILEDERQRIKVEFAAVPDLAQQEPVPSTEILPLPVSSSVSSSFSLSPTSQYAADLYFSYSPADGPAVQIIRGRLRSWQLGIVDSGLSGTPTLGAVEANMHHADLFVLCLGRRGLSTGQRREMAVAFERRKHDKRFQIIPLLLPQGDPHAARAFPSGTLIDLSYDYSGLENLVRLARGEILPVEPNPYRGLEPYREEDAASFFGREKETEALASTLSSTRVQFLRGDTGCGKTSFVMAGLIPRLRRDPNLDWEVIVFRPGTSPFINLANALQSLDSDSPERGGVLLIARLGQSLAAGEVTLESLLTLTFKQVAHLDRLLIVVDQLEELLTVAQESERKLFLRAILSKTADLPVTILCVVRPEWERDLAAQLDSGARMEPAFALEPLQGTQLEDAFEQLYSGSRSVAHATQMVEAAQSNPASLPWVSESFRILRDHAPDPKDLQPAPNPADLAKASFHSLNLGSLGSSSENPASDSIGALLQLIQPADSNIPGRSAVEPRPVPWQTLDQAVAHRLEIFVDRRLVYVDLNAVAHLTFRSLATEIALLSEDVLAYLKIRGELEERAAAWEKNERKPAYLLPGSRIREASERISIAGSTSSPVRLFVEASLTRAKKRRRLYRSIVGAGLSLVAVLVSLYLVGIRIEKRTWEAAYRAQTAEDYPVAIQLLTRILRLDPENMQAHALRAYAEIKQGSYQSAVDDYTAALAGSTDVRLLRGRAYAYKLLGRFQESRYDLQSSLQSNNDPQALADLKYIDYLLSSQTTVNVVILYLSDAKAQNAKDIADILKASMRYANVFVVHYDSQKVRWGFLQPLELHYFKTSDEQRASDLAQYLRSKRIAVLVRLMGSAAHDAGYLEIWFRDP
jgi:MinD-like ATPase involved in chromosome partitioning or flagellar assembly/tetratricopeptide (TPR) repeat protein